MSSIRVSFYRSTESIENVSFGVTVCSKRLQPSLRTEQQLRKEECPFHVTFLCQSQKSSANQAVCCLAALRVSYAVLLQFVDLAFTQGRVEATAVDLTHYSSGCLRSENEDFSKGDINACIPRSLYLINRDEYYQIFAHLRPFPNDFFDIAFSHRYLL